MTTHWHGINYELYKRQWSASNAQSLCDALQVEFSRALRDNFQYEGKHNLTNEVIRDLAHNIKFLLEYLQERWQELGIQYQLAAEWQAQVQKVAQDNTGGKTNDCQYVQSKVTGSLEEQVKKAADGAAFPLEKVIDLVGRKSTHQLNVYLHLAATWLYVLFEQQGKLALWLNVV